ncbi:MAG: TauD/TfdA family dioxygenase [Novosphingobium sp.]|nr:TauD/TfdA family dioxygenase [Novosphingobium sp.]
MATATLPKLRLELVTGNVGANVHGIELAGTKDPEIRDALQRALHEHGVLFFEYDGIVSADAFHTFGEMFGELENGYRLSAIEDKPTSAEDALMDSAKVPMKQYQTNRWHGDGTLFECPPQAAMLTCVEAPPAGGDTMWASMYAAWDDLSSYLQRMLEEVEVLNSAKRLPWLKSDATAVHPAVCRDPITGRKFLFVNENYSERILGMSEDESETILQMLFRHVNTPEFHVRHRWQPGRIAVWEERVTQHRGVADFTGPRKMRRLTFVGGKPSL